MMLLSTAVKFLEAPAPTVYDPIYRILDQVVFAEK
jgi:hypothetical protein